MIEADCCFYYNPCIEGDCIYLYRVLSESTVEQMSISDTFLQINCRPLSEVSLMLENSISVDLYRRAYFIIYRILSNISEFILKHRLYPVRLGDGKAFCSAQGLFLMVEPPHQFSSYILRGIEIHGENNLHRSLKMINPDDPGRGGIHDVFDSSYFLQFDEKLNNAFVEIYDLLPF